MEYGSSSSELIGKPSSPLPSPSSSAVIYAELLPNIRQVSIFVSLQTPPSPDTRAGFSSDGLSFTIVHDGRVSTLRLPGKVAEFSSLHLLPTSRKELSFRLPLDQATSQATDVGSGNFVPWTASSLAATTSASCRECGVTLMEAQTVKIWKDLPSENWAEMMEFWHCHKPGEHGHPTEINHVGKGYTASEKITARTGLGLVDLCYFLLSEQDCSGVKIATRNMAEKQPQTLACAACQAIIGAADERAEGWRLYKWSLAVHPADDVNVERFRADLFISAHLLTLIENQGIRKFITKTDKDDGATPILLWVFNPDLHYSISPSPSGPKRAMKVFYQTYSAALGQENSKNQSAPLSPEEVYLPLHIHRELRERLHETNQSLPASARKFQEWDIGFLERFEIGE